MGPLDPSAWRPPYIDRSVRAQGLSVHQHLTPARRPSAGESFLCVGGCPNQDEPVAVAQRVAACARDLVLATSRFRGTCGFRVQIRVGLHSGKAPRSVSAIICLRCGQSCLRALRCWGASVDLVAGCDGALGLFPPQRPGADRRVVVVCLRWVTDPEGKIQLDEHLPWSESNWTSTSHRGNPTGRALAMGVNLRIGRARD